MLDAAAPRGWQEEANEKNHRAQGFAIGIQEHPRPHSKMTAALLAQGPGPSSSQCPPQVPRSVHFQRQQALTLPW